MHHTLAYFKAIDNTANGDVTALSDQIIPIVNSHFLLPQDMDLMAAYVSAATLNRARLSSPSLRQITQPQIHPISVTLLPPTDPNVMVLNTSRPRLRAREELALQMTSGVAMTENAYGVLWLLDRFQPITPADIYTLRATSTTTAVASQWTQATYTLDDQLPSGLYAIVGSFVFGTTAVAHRWTLDGQFFRPGGLSGASAGLRTFNEQYLGRWGEWGRFYNTSLPRLEILCNAADTASTILLQVQKVG